MACDPTGKERATRRQPPKAVWALPFVFWCGAVGCGALAFGCGEAAAPGADRVAVRIMPLGDSLTESSHGYASYRYWLWKALEERGLEVDFVGSMRGVYMGTPRFDDFDPDHEGHSSWTTANVRDHVEAWVADSDPEVVLLLLGTNDGARDVPGTLANLTAIIETLRAQRGDVAVLLGLLPPVGDRATGARFRGA